MKKIVADYIADVRLITRNVYLFLAGGLLVGVLAAFMQLLLNLYFKDIGYGESFIGRVLSMTAFGGVLAAVPSAYLLARFHIRPLLILSTVFVVGSFLVIATARWEWLILTCAFTYGALQAVRNVAGAPFIMRNTTERERTLVFSLNFSTWIVAGIVGSLGGGWLHDFMFSRSGQEVWSYQFALIVASGIGLLAVIPFALIRAKAPKPDEVERSFSWVALRKKGRLYTKFMIPYFVLGAGAGLIIPFLNLYFKNRFGLDPGRIGVYFSILQLTMLVAVLIVPVLKRWLGFIRTVALTELISIPFMLVLCYTDSLEMAFWAFLLRGALMNMSNPVSSTFMMEAVTEADHALLNSIASISWAVSWAVSTQIGGIMIERSGFVPVFQLAIALYLVSAALYYYYFARCERREGEQIVIDTARIR